MTMLAVDLSNYSSALTPENLQALKDAGVGHVIVQAVDPPPGYPHGLTRQQIQALLAAGFTVDAYIWLWFDLGPDDIARKLALLDGLSIRQLWLDVEDTASSKYDQATCEGKVSIALQMCDNHPTTGGQSTGVYSGRWFWTDRRYMGNTTTFGDRELWDANYDDVADAALGFVPYGGWTLERLRIKQFRGTTSVGGIGGLDLNVLSVAEEGELHQPEPPQQPQEDPCAGPVSSLGLIAGDLLAPVVKLKSPASKPLQRLVAGIRHEADANGINHA